MNSIKRLYLNFYLVVLALYVYFDKGIAYSFLSEVLLVAGVVLLILNYRSLEIPWNKRIFFLLVFLLVTAVFVFRGVRGYPFMEVIRDSFMFNYILFVFVLFLFKDDMDYFMEKLGVIYQWFPLVAVISFLCLSYVPYLAQLEVFGGQLLLLYKYGDLSVHLFIVTMLLLNGYIKMGKKFMVINAVLIAYLYLIASSYSRAGMLAYIISFGVFYFFSVNRVMKKQLVSYLKYVPVILLIALPIYLGTNVKENFQGRKLGLDQLKENATSVFSPDAEGTLSDNKVWRLVWWGKIIDYTFGGEYFLAGKGLGMSLASDDEIPGSEDGELRSPHNFHMTVLARYGVPFFVLWLAWIFLHFKRIWQKGLDPLSLMLLVISLTFIFNASFDVYLEGPMGAFPFWTFVGLLYTHEAFGIKKDPIILTTKDKEIEKKSS
ncbi:MAG: O-antigen ligase family protein [Bacteroidota bacterium]